MPIAAGFYRGINALARGLTSAGDAVGHGLVNGINRAGEIAYDVGDAIGQKEHQLLDPTLTRLGLRSPPAVPRDTFAERGYPSYMHMAAPPSNLKWVSQGVLGDYDPHTLPQQIPTIAAYRADPTGRFGGKDGLETLPSNFDPQATGPGWGYRPGKTPGHMTSFTTTGNPVNLYAYAREMGRAAKYGVPQLSAVQLAAMALKEGRDDFGANMYDHNNPQLQALAQRLYPKMYEASIDWYAKHAGVGSPHDVVRGAKLFPVVVAEKMAVAKRLNIPFAEAWNGTGSNGRSTGAQYAKGFEYALKAAQHPKNKQLVDFIQSALDAGARDR
jgi:hypothetical protein